MKLIVANEDSPGTIIKLIICKITLLFRIVNEIVEDAWKYIVPVQPTAMR